MSMGTHFVTMEVPVPSGTPVYVIEDCYCYTKKYADQCRIRNGSATSNASAVAISPAINVKRGFRCAKVYLRPFDPIKHLAKWGRSVFETSEAAVEAARKRQGGNV